MSGGGWYSDSRWVLLLSITMCMTPILNIPPQLVLPKYFLSSQACMVTLLNLVNYLHWKIQVATPISPIVVAQPPIHPLDLLFMVTMSSFENGGTFSHILPLALFAGGKINYKTAVAVQPLLDGVGSPSVSTCEGGPLLKNRAGNPATSTSEATSIPLCVFFLHFLSE